MKIHHKMKHDESLAIETSQCENCGEDFKYYPSSKDGYYCSNCVEDVTWETGETPSGEENHAYSGGKDIKKCNICFNYFTTYKKNQKTCGQVCGNIQSGKTISGDGHWRWKGG